MSRTLFYVTIFIVQLFIAYSMEAAPQSSHPADSVSIVVPASSDTLFEVAEVVDDEAGDAETATWNASLDVDDDDDNGSISPAVLALIGLFFMPPLLIVAVLWLILHNRQRRLKERLLAYSAMREKGIEISDEMLETPRHDPMRSGIMLACIGVGIFLFFLFLGEWRIGGAIGAIPFMVGVARVLTSIYSDRH